MDKVIRDGKVAVLYSPTYGAGWWYESCDPSRLFDPHLVQLIEQGLYQAAETYSDQRWPDQYNGGVYDLTIAWIPQGKHFRITEYDGAESIEYRDQIKWIKA